ncbi:MAG: imidazole glycerol phosphate synthase subunit HisH [Deltaproteobacteria bacterium]|nr:MAG: imidazole glycerol phosphate synthase subunit HisH [Deltaproteobacteria bacterium]
MKGVNQAFKKTFDIVRPSFLGGPVVIVDYGMGNLRSVQKAFEKVGAKAVISGDPETIAKAKKIVLPGVGAFSACMDNLTKANLIEPIRAVIEEKKPFLGICMGMQVLMEESEEFGTHKGLGLLKGKVIRFKLAKKYKIPHMGWNRITKKKACPLLLDVQEGAAFYFVHSYHVVPRDSRPVVATANYGKDFVAMVQQDNIFACQFHPEKSQKEGLKIIKAFAKL